MKEEKPEDSEELQSFHKALLSLTAAGTEGRNVAASEEKYPLQVPS